MSKQVKDNEEVDLGSLFIIIGKAFSKVGNFIASIFKGLFNFLIETLLFLKSNSIKIGIATLIGVIIGFFFEFKSETLYEANLFVKPNFSSSRQLYNNINFYNDLVKQKEVEQIKTIFNITLEEAKSLKKFEINPIVNENDILNSYDDLIQSIDTSTVKSYSYTKFKNAFTQFDYKIHEITVNATKNNVFAKLDKAIIESIVNNDYFKTLKKTNKSNLLRTDSLLRRNLQQADSLYYIYKEVLIEEAKKPNSSTSINLSGNTPTSNNKEQELFNAKMRLNDNLIDVNKDLSEKSEVINIVSNFEPIGHKVKAIQKNKAFQFGLLGFVLMIIALLLLKLNSYLDSYKTKKESH
ncbi:hypothetical protein ACOSP6_05945 [Tenacibaculum sp. MEBiC06402]|uniref:hypothetical protein n=1 Tax=unclassified Tenacibaculum TaxID=2635139 RepID=UPI003B9CFBC1